MVNSKVIDMSDVMNSGGWPLVCPGKGKSRGGVSGKNQAVP